MKPKVSFILPVYNVENYLHECINSIVCQTFKDFEILLVDDGSPDSSPTLCDEWAVKDSRIRVFHKRNGGSSDARNYGLRKALGEYVIFVDSDDYWLGSDYLEKLMRIVNTEDFDFLNFNCNYYYPEQQKHVKWNAYNENILSTTSPSELLYQLQKQGMFPMSAWMKLIKRSFLIDNNIFFIKGLIGEDIPWMIDLMNKAKSIKFVNEYVYAYRQNSEGSITSTFTEKAFTDFVEIIESELSKVESRTFSKNGKKALYSFLAYEYCILLASSVRYKDYKKKLRELRRFKWLLKYDKNPKVRITKISRYIIGYKLTAKLLTKYYISK